VALNKKQQQVYNRIATGKHKTLLVGEAGCVDAKTEYLTPTGWKYISDFTPNDKIATITKDKELLWEQPLDYISIPGKHKAYLIADSTKRSKINMVLTPNHRMPYVSKENSNEWNTDTVANVIGSLTNKRVLIGLKTVTTSIALSDCQLQLLLAIQADASIIKRKHHFYVRFKLKKERKIQRLHKLLKLNNIKYTETYTAHNYTNISFVSTNTDIVSKDLTILYNASVQQAKLIAEEVTYWDGSKYNRTNNPIFYSGNKTNIDVIQYCFMLASNTMASIKTRDRIGTTILKGSDYKVKNIHYEVGMTLTESVYMHKKYVTEITINHQYCFTTSTSFWLARRNGFIFITGNSGKSYTVSEIVKIFNPENIALTATTHKAKAVISQMTGVQANTVHSYFGFRIIQDNYKQTLVFTGKQIQPKKLVIVDEVSLLPQQILDHLLHLNKKRIIKQLLLIGDPVQLKAVSNPPDLSPFSKHTIELTEQMRQQPEVSLTEYFTRLRTAIETTKMPDLKTVVPNITFIASHKEFCYTYNDCNTNKKILAYRNIVVDKYNNYIHGANIFREGDDVIIDKPLGTARNGDEVKVRKATEDDEKFTVFVRTTDGIDYKIYHYKSTSAVNNQLEIYRKANDKASYWKLFNSSFRLKHSYACTVHKAQGETYDTVFVDVADILTAYQAKKSRYNNPIPLDTFLRLYYVALSRMKSHAYVYTGADNKGRDYKQLKSKGKQLE